MRHRSTLSGFTWCAAGAMAVASALGADDPQKTFDDVFGENYRKAIATPATDDDVELAKDLSKAVLTIDMPASLMKVITDKLMALSEKALGAALPTVDALDKLAAKEPKEKQDANAKSLTLLEKVHAGGESSEARNDAANRLLTRLVPIADQEFADRKLDAAVTHYRQAVKLARDTNSRIVDELIAKLATAMEAQKQLAEVDSLEKKLEANPKDAESRLRLIRIHLVERNDPSAAVWFMGEGVDATTMKLLPVAAKDAASAEPRVLADLGAWYLDLADGATAQAKVAMLRRSKNYYERFLAQHKENDLLKAKATLSLEQIDKKLKDAESAVASASPTTPNTPNTPNTPTAPVKSAGNLTVAIDGPTITEPDRVDRLFAQHARIIAKGYVSIGDDFAPAMEYDAKYPSSAGETLSAVTKRLTTVKEVRDGFILRRVTVPPVPAEAEAVAMALPAFNQGAYGYLHSVEVKEITGAEDLVVKNVWLVDAETLATVSYDERKEREKLRQRQNDFNFGDNTLRLHGYPTAGLKVGDRIGMVGKGKPLQIIIVKTEPQPGNFFKKERPVAALVSKLQRGLDETEFEKLLEKRNLTHTDLVNLYLEAQRSSARDAVKNTIRRIEAKGAKLP